MINAGQFISTLLLSGLGGRWCTDEVYDQSLGRGLVLAGSGEHAEPEGDQGAGGPPRGPAGVTGALRPPFPRPRAYLGAKELHHTTLIERIFLENIKSVGRNLLRCTARGPAFKEARLRYSAVEVPPEVPLP